MLHAKNIFLFTTVFFFLGMTMSVMGQSLFEINTVHQTQSYSTGARHTLSFELRNKSKSTQEIMPSLELPDSWQMHTNTSIHSIPAGKKKWVYISFTIPKLETPGKVYGHFLLSTANQIPIRNKTVSFNIGMNHDIQLKVASFPKALESGEKITSKYEIINLGNVAEMIQLSSVNTLIGESKIEILPGESKVIEVEQETSKKSTRLQSVSTRLDVEVLESEIVKKAFSTTQVFPNKIIKKDAFFRYNMEASLYHSNYITRGKYYDAQFIEVKGNGYLDTLKDHHINMIVRAPNQSNLTRLAVNDQYSLTYRYQDKTTIQLGDHTFNINKLGFASRYGIGAKIDQSYKNWIFSVFYSKPRLFYISKKPIFGGKAIYQHNDNLRFGLSLTSSNDIAQYNNNQGIRVIEGGGQILVLEGSYLTDNTTITTELASSINKGEIDFATDLNLTQRLGKFYYNGNLTLAGENYFGMLNNSVRYSNAINYQNKKLMLGVGQSYSKVNERIDSTIYGIQPYFQNKFISAGYRFNMNQLVNIRAYERIREDLSVNQIFNYREKGINYRYQYKKSNLSVNLNGRIGRTQNLFLDGFNIRNTYGHFLNAHYKINKQLSVRGSFSHNHTNRYSRANSLNDYFLYGAGLNYTLSQSFRFNANYNSGFSPEETYKKRDLINAGFFMEITRNHQIEARVNYYMNPSVTNKRELFAFVKYTFKFGVPLKKMLKLGGIKGRVFSSDPSISLKGIQFIADGLAVKSNSKGEFELNNINEGTHQLRLEESSLPMNVVTKEVTPIEISILENASPSVVIELVKAKELHGQLIVDEYDQSLVLSGEINLKNSLYNYTVRADKNGKFRFTRIVPGNYTLSINNLTENTLVPFNKKTEISLMTNDIEKVELMLRERVRKIKFKNTTIQVSE